MSTWRRKAIALFPEIRPEVDVQNAQLHEFFWELERIAEEAHAKGDEEALRRVHGFAEWCLHQGGKLWDDAAIGFYEDLFGDVAWERIIPWLSPFVVDQIRRTWALLDEGHRDKFEKLVRERREYPYRTHAYSTNEIDHL